MRHNCVTSSLFSNGDCGGCTILRPESARKWNGLLAPLLPRWRQQYPRLILGLGSINASTADSSQRTASDADGVRPDSGGPPPCEAQVDPVEVRSRPGRRHRRVLALLAPARVACRVARGNWGLGIGQGVIAPDLTRSATSFLKTDEQAWPRYSRDQLHAQSPSRSTHASRATWSAHRASR